jgi:hypothetical protein
MKRSDYIEKRKEIIAECEDKLSALDKVFQMFGGTPIINSGSPVSVSRNGWEHATSKRDAIRNAVKAVTLPQFTLKDVRDVLESNFSDLSAGITDNQLSAILSKLAEMGEIAIFKRKAGKSPAIYTKAA